MDLQELLQTSPENLAEKQMVALKNATIQRLYDIINYIKKNDFESVNGLMSYSPAGDGMGTDRNYICFEDFLGESREGYDLSDVMDRLIELRNIKNVKE